MLSDYARSCRAKPTYILIAVTERRFKLLGTNLQLILFLLDPAFIREMIEQALDAALGHVEPRRKIRQPVIAAGVGHRVEEREAMGKLRLDDAHVIGTSFHQG